MKMISKDDLQSKTIDCLRFPLCVGVVLIHSELFQLTIGGGKIIQHESLFPIYHHFSYLIGSIANIAVPLFFFISGFLFFYKVDKFSRNIYIYKIKKRAKTLLVPYIFWNLLMLLMVFVSQLLFPDMTSGKKKLIVDYSLYDWLSAFWAISNKGEAARVPIDYPLWFIRDLMIVMLCSPLVFFCIKKIRIYCVIILGVLYLFPLWKDVTGLSLTAWFYFIAGAWFSINKKNFVECKKPIAVYVTLIYIMVLLFLTLFMGNLGDNSITFKRISILIGIVCAITLSACYIERGGRVNTFLSKSCFFIFAYHALVLSTIQRLVIKLLQPQSDLTLVISYLLAPTITICIGLLAYYCLRRWFPNVMPFVTGGR